MAILSPNRPELLEVLFATWKAGLAAVPMNFRLHRDEVRYILNHSEAKMLVHAGVYQDDLDRIAGDLAATRFSICLDGLAGKERGHSLTALDYRALLDSGDAAEWVEPVKAVVALRPGHAATEAELISFYRNHLASYKKPRSVDFVEELPKNAYGKVLKRHLRARYWDGRTRMV